MRYTVVGASYHQKSLSVFYAGLDGQEINSYEAAQEEALRLLEAELQTSSQPEIQALAETVSDFQKHEVLDLNDLDNKTSEALSVSWFDDHHFVIAVMNAKESYQLHLEVLPTLDAED
ncbi:hypothetical protein [Lacticaseibacillus saniviri]|uniref:hypothetical protein n=1 Tax=Lacticaseibacillus saniviri TaxID=931533 RepID=UPI0011CA42AF|nr:hypothetical protein [Lacticaseibacillus saniviri]MCG4282936.1 hypothetical protein [Lacticaseibacillus saniviri]